MTLLRGITTLGAGRAAGAAAADTSVSGVPHLAGADIRTLLGVRPGVILRDQPPTAYLTDGSGGWPLDLVRTRAVAENIDVAKLDQLVPHGSAERFVDMATARQLSDLDAANFASRIQNGSLPTVLIERHPGSGILERVIPAHVLDPRRLDAPAAAADAALGAAGVAPAVERASIPRPVPGRPAGASVLPPRRPSSALPARSVEQPVKRSGASTGPLHAIRAALTAKPDYTIGAAVGITASGVMAYRSRGAGSSGSTVADDSAAPAPARSTAPKAEPTEPRPQPVAPSAPTIDPKVAARGAQIAKVATGEVGTKESYDPAGMVTGRVREYYKSSAQVRPHRDWDWPGFFVAWARETAGAPITPPGHDWLIIDELIAQAKSHGLWKDKPLDHTPIAGEVVLLNTGVDRTANDAAIVVGVDGDQLRVVQGWSGERGNRSVAEKTIARTDPRIRGYIGIANGGT